MKELEYPCKELIRKGLCLGCNRLELDEFTGDIECEYYKRRKNGS